jgi:hypothetical protein
MQAPIGYQLRCRSTGTPCSPGSTASASSPAARRRAPHKPLLLLYALARLKHDRQTEIRFNATEAALQPLLRVYGPWGRQRAGLVPYSRLIRDGLWQLPDRADLFDAADNIREGVARERNGPAGFTPDVCSRRSSGSQS